MLHTLATSMHVTKGTRCRTRLTAHVHQEFSYLRLRPRTLVLHILVRRGLRSERELCFFWNSAPRYSKTALGITPFYTHGFPCLTIISLHLPPQVPQSEPLRRFRNHEHDCRYRYLKSLSSSPQPFISPLNVRLVH